MIPEEIILNAAENIQSNLARLTNLEVKHQQLESNVDNIVVNFDEKIDKVSDDLKTKYNYLVSFSRRLVADNVTGKYSSENDAIAEAFKLFYASDDTSDMASAQVGVNTLIFVKSRASVNKLILLDTTNAKFYTVDKSTGSYKKDLMFYGQYEVTAEITIAIASLRDTLTNYIETQDKMVMNFAQSLSDGDRNYTDSSFANAVEHAGILFTQINDRLNAILEGADEDFNSFKELSDQIAAFKLEHADFLSMIDSLTTDVVLDSESTSIVRTLAHNTDYSYNADDISSIILKIPSDAEHGYAAGVNFKTNTKPGFTLVNNSRYPLKFLVNGRSVTSFTPEANQNYICLAQCNGINILFQIVEIE